MLERRPITKPLGLSRATLVLACALSQLASCEQAAERRGGQSGSKRQAAGSVGLILSPRQLDARGVPAGFVRVPAGRFTMGSPASERCRDADETAHAVQLTRAFALATHETTQAAFGARMGYQPAFHRDCPSCPVEWISWHEAAAYCNALSREARRPACYRCRGQRVAVRCERLAGAAAGSRCGGFRLPTEAEWERAARGGQSGALANASLSSCMTRDERVDALAWTKANSTGRTHAVGRRKPNPLGLYDIAGNVYEWVDDWYGPYPGVSAPSVDPLGPPAGRERVLRGGAWYTNVEHARHANRERYFPQLRLTFAGFRCALTLARAGAKP
jgi:formylglycine-generating enzyme required for sulfatase activity